MTISRNGRERNLSVRITSEQSGESSHGYVVTLDDITELVAAQRTSAWADVARRIAHEIKNPLTPIQLSAERLRRKYGNMIGEDRAVFEQCTDTIVRQVDDIRRMVDEFSRFARMPKPVITAEDVADTVRQAVFLLRVGNSEIDIDCDIAEDPMPARFDRRLMSQALTNLIKNATEAIAAVPPADLGKGSIRVFAMREGGDIVIDVVDNGVGLPTENRSRCSSRMSRRARRVPDLGSPSWAASSRIMAVASSCMTRPAKSPDSGAPGCVCVSPPPATRKRLNLKNRKT